MFPHLSFNLVIERLLISGDLNQRCQIARRTFQSRYRAASHFRQVHNGTTNPSLVVVSISLSSGFSFQVYRLNGILHAGIGFNLVIERLLISGSQAVRIVVSPSSFNLVIERLLISGEPVRRWNHFMDKFQSRYRAASHFRSDSSRGGSRQTMRFNLVIERLLISGAAPRGIRGHT